MNVLHCCFFVCILTLSTKGAGSPTDILSVRIELDGSLALQVKGIPESLSSQHSLKSVRMLVTRQNIEWMENNGFLVNGFSRKCNLALEVDVTKSRYYTNQPWFATAVRNAELLRNSKTVLLWTDAATFLQARADLRVRPPKTKTTESGRGQQPPVPPIDGSKKNSNGEISGTEGCELEGEVCFSSDGTASFTLSCGALSLSLNTKGEFSVQAKGADGASSTVTIGGKTAR